MQVSEVHSYTFSSKTIDGYIKRNINIFLFSSILAETAFDKIIMYFLYHIRNIIYQNLYAVVEGMGIFFKMYSISQGVCEGNIISWD